MRRFADERHRRWKVYLAKDGLARGRAMNDPCKLSGRRPKCKDDSKAL